MAAVVQLTRAGTIVGDRHTLDRARDAFARHHLIRIPSFFSADLLDEIERTTANSTFNPRVHSEAHGATDVALDDERMRWLLMVVMNEPTLFSVIRSLTACDEIGCFFPTVYKLVPGSGHFDRWHDDAKEDNRLIGMSINLGRQPFAGGVLQIRRKGTEAILHAEHNTRFGDAMIFRIDRALEHFVTEVTGDIARIALAGWFQRTPVFRDLAADVFAAASGRT
jgi:hypothetical protein